MSQESPNNFRWSSTLAEENYLNRRLRPPFRDLDYLPLGDLFKTVSHFANSLSGSLFDYGCGGKPYRNIFARCTPYIGADIISGPSVDRILLDSGLTGEKSDSYDVVLSSQVLEHVLHPSDYVREALRILKPGGHFVLTTHGMFLEHGCPHDYYRWTGYGLAHLLQEEGFLIEQTVKITPGPRASIYLFHIAVETFRCPEKPIWHYTIATLRKLYRLTLQPALNWLCGLIQSRPFLDHTANEPIYIGVGVLARKPFPSDTNVNLEK